MTTGQGQAAWEEIRKQANRVCQDSKNAEEARRVMLRSRNEPYSTVGHPEAMRTWEKRMMELTVSQAALWNHLERGTQALWEEGKTPPGNVKAIAQEGMAQAMARLSIDRTSQYDNGRHQMLVEILAEINSSQAETFQDAIDFCDRREVIHLERALAQARYWQLETERALNILPEIHRMMEKDRGKKKRTFILTMIAIAIAGIVVFSACVATMMQLGV